ncbi:MAG: ankyrin repeat domain-containing protein [Candidatus Muiribacteriota bacterium]
MKNKKKLITFLLIVPLILFILSYTFTVRGCLSEENEYLTEIKRRGYKFSPEFFTYLAGKGDVDDLELFLNAGMYIGAVNELGQTAIFNAVRNNKNDNVKFLLQKGANPDCYDNTNLRILTLAIQKRNFENAKVIMDYGADINYDFLQHTAFTYALNLEQYKIAEYMIEKGLEVNSVNKMGDTPLIKSIRKGTYRLTYQLILNDADIEKRERFNDYTPLMQAASVDNFRAANLLIERGADIDFINENGETAFEIAVKSDSDKIVLRLIEKGANHKISSSDDFVPLIHFVRQENSKMVEYLLENDFSPNRKNRTKTPLIEAVYSGHNRIVKTLIKYGAHVNDRTADYDYPLAIAVANNKKNIVKTLVEANANINKEQEMGVTPLIRYLDRKDYDMVEFLLQNGADPDKPSGTDNKYPLIFAIDMGCLDLCDLLLEYNADINMRFTNRKITPLIYAVENEKYDLAKKLIEKGAQINLLDNLGNSALYYARVTQNQRLIDLLERNIERL